MPHFFHTQIPNQLEVLAESHARAKSVSVAFFVRSGSRFESPAVSGISHFLEHLVFKGSQTRSALDVNREFDAMGISFNACTMEESTIFYSTLLPEFLEPCLEIYADILRPAIREEDFRSEKEVVLEEIGMYENEPPFCFDDRLRQAFFNGHPLGNPVLGSVRSVRSLTRRQVKKWIREKYAPQNIQICACGKVDFDELVRLAQKYCGKWENGPEKPTVGVPRDFNPRLGRRKFYRSQATREYALGTSFARTSTFRQTLTARLIASILGDDSGSRLYWEFVDSGRAEHAVLNFVEYSEGGCFNSSLACEPEDARQNRARLKKIFRGAQAGDISEAELSLAKNRLTTACVLGSERGSNRIFTVGGDWMASREYHTIEEEVETLRSITLEEIGALLNAFPLTDSLTFSVGPPPNRGATSKQASV